MLLFASFSLNVSAAGTANLIDPNLKNWTVSDLSYLDDVTTHKLSQGNIYRVGMKSPSGAASGIIYDIPSLIAGHSYSFSFHIPDAIEISEASGTSFLDSTLLKYYDDATLNIGYGFIKSDGSFEDGVQFYSLNSSNISKYVGEDLKASFVAGSSTGRPVIYITVTVQNESQHFFYFSDLFLIDNDDNSQELKGIRGFLHSIRWDLVGGVCDEEDCPHSYNNNPHLSLTERMSAGFATMLDNIGNKFEEGSTLNTWFSNLSSGVTNLGDRISGFFNGLGDRISGFFNGLGDRISGFFDKLKENVTSGFTNVGTWFTNLGTNLSTWFDGVKLKFQEVGDGIKQKFQDIADKFTEFFEKFKPRVYVDLKWVRGLVNWSTGELLLKDDTSPYVVVSELFEVPHGTKYLIDYKFSDTTKALAVHKYDLSGTFISSQAYSKSLEGFELESGFKYRFRTTFTTGVTDLSVVNDYVMIYSDEGWINALFFNLKMGIRNLFVPDEDAILVLKTDLDKCLKDHLGIIYTSTTLVGDFIETVFDMVFNAPDDYELIVPAVTLELSGENYTLWEDTYIDFSFMETEVFQILYGLYTVSLYIFFGFLEVKYAQRVYRRMMSN